MFSAWDCTPADFPAHRPPAAAQFSMHQPSEPAMDLRSATASSPALVYSRRNPLTQKNSLLSPLDRAPGNFVFTSISIKVKCQFGVHLWISYDCSACECSYSVNLREIVAQSAIKLDDFTWNFGNRVQIKKNSEVWKKWLTSGKLCTIGRKYRWKFIVVSWLKVNRVGIFNHSWPSAWAPSTRQWSARARQQRKKSKVQRDIFSFCEICCNSSSYTVHT